VYLALFNLLLVYKLEVNFWRKCAQSIMKVVNQVRRLGGNGNIASMPLEQSAGSDSPT